MAIIAMSNIIPIYVNPSSENRILTTIMSPKPAIALIHNKPFTILEHCPGKTLVLEVVNLSL